MRALRPIYPYSVIPGGAYSAAELRVASQRDRVVAGHYADFDLAAARVVTLAEDRYQYVSFRLKNRVYWTQKKLRIPRGEILLTDGRHYARTSCGNRLSSKPNLTTSLQPSERILSLPAFQPELLSKGEITLPTAPQAGELPNQFGSLPFALPRLAPLVPAEEGALSQLLPATPIYVGVPIAPAYIATPTQPPAVLTPGFPGLVFSPPPGIEEIPEPASLYLFALSLFSSLWFLTRMMRFTAPLQEEASRGGHRGLNQELDVD